ncbi:gamma-aminobutyric acid type B receptor subunit 2-like [Acanthochromis polyacanthus]|uniref:gamma-aminobutyric acid type B receptor subunit 2-like n=1 Tax=Acanthochromis polyacanthus TaxID=80966 RepID=UPI0022348F1D|nr:gamma-aminobutyric acid type B receptor subunit 2-like [Acanthochromis polyacanthus]
MALCGRLLLLLGFCWLTQDPVLAQVRHPLPVLWMMPLSSGSGKQNLTADVLPAVRLALQDLEDQPPPLGNYEVQLQLLDSQCDPAKALKALFDAMWAGPKHLLLIGGVCPPVTALIARSLPALHLVQVSFAASSPSLSNRKWFGNLFSTMPSDRVLNQAAVKLLQRFRWTRVGVITQEGARLSEMKKDLLRQLLKADVQLVASESFSADACSSLKKLKDRDVRIIIAHFEDDSASEVFCCAYRLNLFGPRYQWIVSGTGPGWRLGWKASGCSANSLLTAADGSIRLQIRLLSRTNTVGVSGRTPQDYQDSYLRHLDQNSELGPLHSFVYDAVWVAARALVQVMEAQKHQQKYNRNVTVGEEATERMLLEVLKGSQFQGVTGPVSFRNGERMTSVELIQFQGSSSVLVGEFNTSSQQLRLINHLVRFKGGAAARDQTEVHLQQRHAHFLFYSFLFSAAAGTIIITTCILIFITCNHRHWLLSSRGGSQDQLLLLGVLLSSSSVLVSALEGLSLSDQTSEILCSVRLWTLSLGHTVGLTVLFNKAWSLYSLPSFDQKRRRPAGGILLWFFLLDVLVLISWQILDPLRWVVLQLSTEVDPADPDILIHPFSEHCSSTNMEMWISTICSYKAPLLVRTKLAIGLMSCNQRSYIQIVFSRLQGLCCFVSWSIRTADVSSVRLLVLTVFAVTVFSVSGLLGSLLTSHDPPVQLCVSGVLVLCCNAFILVGLFGPKIVLVCWSSSNLQPPTELQSDAAEDEDLLSRMKLQLESQSAQLDVQIETIIMQLCEESESETLHCLNREKPGKHRCARWTHEAQICADIRSSKAEASSPDDINSPEQVGRRLSVQLPILHHSYLPVIGGVSSSSSSSLFGSRDAFLYHHDNFLYT